MGRIWMCGFEQDSLDVFSTLNLTVPPTISSVDARTDTHCFLTAVSLSTGFGRVTLPAVKTEIFVRVYIKTDTNTPNASCSWIRLLDSNLVTLLEISETGQVWLGAIGAGVDKGNAGPLTTAYKRWEIRFLVDNAAGLLDVRVDGISAVSDSGIDTRVGSVDEIVDVDFGNVSSGTTHDSKRYDDIAINDTLGLENNSWCGQGAILGCVSIADGATNEFSRFPDTGEANWEDVNERPPDDDTTYVFATDVEQTELYDVTSMELTHLVPRATQVKAVAWWMYNRLRYNGDGEIAALHVQSGFLQEMPAVACNEIDYDYSDITVREENSVTSAEFNAGDIDDSEFGFRSKAP